MSKPLSENASYCIQFLRNAGERMRAAQLLMELADINGIEALRQVDGLKTPVPLSSNRELKRRCLACNIRDLHPDTPRCPSCGGYATQYDPTIEP